MYTHTHISTRGHQFGDCLLARPPVVSPLPDNIVRGRVNGPLSLGPPHLITRRSTAHTLVNSVCPGLPHTTSRLGARAEVVITTCVSLSGISQGNMWQSQDNLWQSQDNLWQSWDNLGQSWTLHVLLANKL